MDAATLSKVMGGALTLSAYQAKVAGVNAGLIAAQCTTPQRVAMWCAQVGTESLGLRYMEEIASGAEYEGRRDLGNTQPGDGPRFKGHGPIQITGRANHAAVSVWAHANGYVPTADYFIQNPQALASDQYGFLGVAWYWTVARNMNRYADAGDILGATRAVNGGTNGLADRTARWNRIKGMGDVLLPEGEDDMSKEDIDNINKKLDALGKDVDALTKALAAVADQTKQARINAASAFKILNTPLSYKIGSKVNSASPRSVWANTRIEAARATAAGNGSKAAVKAAAAADATASQRIDKAVADVDAHLDEVDTEIHSAGMPDPEAAAVAEANK